MISEHIHDLIQSVETEFFAVACIGTVFNVDVYGSGYILGIHAFENQFSICLNHSRIIYYGMLICVFFYLFFVDVVWLVLACSHRIRYVCVLFPNFSSKLFATNSLMLSHIFFLL